MNLLTCMKSWAQTGGQLVIKQDQEHWSHYSINWLDEKIELLAIIRLCTQSQHGKPFPYPDCFPVWLTQVSFRHLVQTSPAFLHFLFSLVCQFFFCCTLILKCSDVHISASHFIWSKLVLYLSSWSVLTVIFNIPDCFL